MNICKTVNNSHFAVFFQNKASKPCPKCNLLLMGTEGDIMLIQKAPGTWPGGESGGAPRGWAAVTLIRKQGVGGGEGFYR